MTVLFAFRPIAGPPSRPGAAARAGPPMIGMGRLTRVALRSPESRGAAALRVAGATCPRAGDPAACGGITALRRGETAAARPGLASAADESRCAVDSAALAPRASSPHPHSAQSRGAALIGAQPVIRFCRVPRDDRPACLDSSLANSRRHLPAKTRGRNSGCRGLFRSQPHSCMPALPHRDAPTPRARPRPDGNASRPGCTAPAARAELRARRSMCAPPPRRGRRE